MFAQAEGIGSLSDFQMAGAVPHVYHYAHYLAPATISALSGAGAYEVYASFHLPFGVMLTGLSAFAMSAALWGGPWPGVAASFALMLLPDGYQQGFSNRFLSYNFLQQVNIGGLYGVSVAAMAWILIFDGCIRNRLSSVVFGWLAALVLVSYKAQIFVASAFLIMIFPTLFFGSFGRKARCAVLVLQVIIFVSVVNFSQTLEGVPTIRLDGSGRDTYTGQLLWSFDPGFLKTFFSTQVQKAGQAWVAFIPLAAIVLLCTFGFWIPGLIIVSDLMFRRSERMIIAFPFLVLANYLVMALFLAMDENQIGTPEEFLNRPLVWAYFVLVTWISGGAYALALGNRPPQTRRESFYSALALILSLGFPFAFSKNLQTFPAWEGRGSHKEFGSVPACLVQSARFVRNHSQWKENVVDSENDRSFKVTSLSERQVYVVDPYIRARVPKGLDERLNLVEAWKNNADEDQVRKFAESERISWLILHPESKISWPKTLQDTPAFECEGYRVYRFRHHDEGEGKRPAGISAR
jgi:hypothetical protein